MSARSVAPLTVNGALDDDGGCCCCCCCCWAGDCRRPSGTHGHHPETITPIGPVAGPIRPHPTLRILLRVLVSSKITSPRWRQVSSSCPSVANFLPPRRSTLFPAPKNSYDGDLIRKLAIFNCEIARRAASLTHAKAFLQEEQIGSGGDGGCHVLARVWQRVLYYLSMRLAMSTKDL